MNLDIIYEICRYNIEVYRVAIYDRRFHSYMLTGDRVAALQRSHTVEFGGIYRLCGRLHRVDGPSGDDSGPAISVGNTQVWYQFGELHREGGPAEIFLMFPPGSIHGAGPLYKEKWYYRGKLHRDGPPLDGEYNDKRYSGEVGPAIIDPRGFYSWYRHGKRHRIGGPAVVTPMNFEEWYQDGELHREDGPAIIDRGDHKWYWRGKLHRGGPSEDGDNGPAVDLRSGTRMWYRHGELHRTNGPAVIDPCGRRKWYRNGLLHRDDGPAFTRLSGLQKWYRDGLLHRDGGPAITFADGKMKWYRDGVEYHP